MSVLLCRLQENKFRLRVNTIETPDLDVHLTVWRTDTWNGAIALL